MSWQRALRFCVNLSLTILIFPSVLSAQGCEEPPLLIIEVLSPPQGAAIIHEADETPQAIAAGENAGATLAIAVSELRTSLAPLTKVRVETSRAQPECGYRVVLSATGPERDHQDFTIEQDGRTIAITAKSEIVVLYGVYQFLEEMEFRWYPADPLWHIRPDRLTWPRFERQKDFSP